MQGKLIVFEGIDGCGKDTQIELLRDKLINGGCDVELLANVSSSPIGIAIREVLSKPELYVSSIQMATLFLSELFIVDKQIKEALDNNKTIIMSRWYYSTLAYAGKRLEDWLTIKKIASNLTCIPDYLIYLDVQPATSIQRINNRANNTDKQIEVYEDIHRLAKIHKLYDNVLDMIKLEKGITKAIRINGEKSIEQVASDIYNELK